MRPYPLGSNYCSCGVAARVTQTRETRLGDIRRRRECPKCGQRFSTLETVLYRDLSRKETT